MNDDLQLDLFGYVPPAEPPQVAPTASADGKVEFRYSAHLKKSVRCRRSSFFGRPELILPEFMKAPEFGPSRELAAAWAECVFKRKTAKNKSNLKSLMDRFWQAVEQTLADRGEKPLAMYGRLPPISPKGEVHDLDQVFAAVNDTYFNGELKCRMTWSNRIGGLSFHSLRKDPITGEDIHLISISRGYDMPNCPVYAVAGVVYHECLHAVIPPEEHGGRRIVHSKTFRQHERRYIYYDEWMRWHKEVLPLNIRAMRRAKRR